MSEIILVSVGSVLFELVIGEKQTPIMNKIEAIITDKLLLIFNLFLRKLRIVGIGMNRIADIAIKKLEK